jgi:hypothetical protein
MELSELTNTELKSILRENQVKNYSKLNKKDLVKKLNQLIKEQNSGKRNNRKNGKKKYKLKQLIGGGPPGEPGTPAEPGAPRGPLGEPGAPGELGAPRGPLGEPGAPAEGQTGKEGNNLSKDPYIQGYERNQAARRNRTPLEPRLAKNAINQNAAQIEGEQSQTSNNLVTSENGNQAANTKNDEQCKACTIL